LIALAIVIFVSILLIFTSLTTFAEGQNSSSVFPPVGKPFGVSYEDHVKNFWKWVLSIPENINPWNDQTGINCSYGQTGINSSVFFLGSNGGGKSERTCKVPAGKGLFIPVSPVEINFKEAPDAKTLNDLHNIAKGDQDGLTSIYLKIDGKEYNDQQLNKYRTHTSDFDVVFPNNPVFGVTEGATKAVADGYYVITEPLSEGNHTIIYKSSLCTLGPGQCPAPDFTQDIKYALIVK
jgi:hypothetical protein